MDIEAIKKQIRACAPRHTAAIARAGQAERYYRKDNDIRYLHRQPDDENPMRSADNRIPSNFYGLLVNQKAAYLFSDPPLFDVGSRADNDRVRAVLGDSYAKKCKSLCIHASNAAVGWLHVWKDGAGRFQYGVVDSRQVVPVWSTGLERLLCAVLRIYDMTDADGAAYTVYEYWTDEACWAFRRRQDAPLDLLCPYRMFTALDLDSGDAQPVNVLRHDWGETPFIPFFNNESETSDLVMVKELIDAYDKVFSGFLNDLEDIQEVIYVLSGYGGEDLHEFIGNLKRAKAIKVDGSDENSKPGVETLTINIPVEAREKMLAITRKAIFEQGQGIDPDPQHFGNASGVALKFLYSLLELKAGLLETEFRQGLGRLVRLICKHLGIAPATIDQTWTRTAVTNDLELAEIASKSIGAISQHTILKRHPWVDDPDEEQKQLAREQEGGEIFPGLPPPDDGENAHEQP